MTSEDDKLKTISQAASQLDLPAYVLRFWESKFSVIRPLKRAGGRRYYRDEDIETLRIIKGLLYEKGHTIKGVQRLIKAQDAGFVNTSSEESVKALSPEDNTPFVVEAPSSPFTGEEVEEAQDRDAAPRSPDLVAEKTDLFSTLKSSEDQALEVPLLHGQTKAEPLDVASIIIRRPKEKREPAAQEPEPSRAKPSKLAEEDLRQLRLAHYELLECHQLLQSVRKADDA